MSKLLTKRLLLIYGIAFLLIAVVASVCLIIYLLPEKKDPPKTLTKEEMLEKVFGSEEDLYIATGELIALLRTVSGGKELDIIFSCSKKEAESSTSLSYIHTTAVQIATKLDNISVVYKNTDAYRYFMKENGSSINPTASSVIFARKSEEGGYEKRYRMYDAVSFYTFLTEENGTSVPNVYSGESVFASAIISLSYDKAPTAYFVTGHGEDVPYSLATGEYNVPEIAKCFLDCGFRVRYIYLDNDEKQFTCTENDCGEAWGKMEIGTSESFDCECGKIYNTGEIEFNEERVIPKDANAVIINNPRSDYSLSELDKLSGYLIGQKGAIMCFTDPVKEDTNKLYNLHSFITNETGVTIKDAQYVVEGQSYDFKGVVAANNAAKAYLGVLTEFGAKQPMLKNSGVLEIDPKFIRDEAFSDVLADRVTLPLIKTTADAVYDGKASAHTVVSVTSLTTMYENEKVQSYFVVSPSAEFVSNEYLSNTMYTNRDILLAIISSTTGAYAPIGLGTAVVEDSTLDFLTMAYLPPYNYIYYDYENKNFCKERV